jgi:hypothetical protein
MTVQPFDHGTLIILSKPFDTRSKALYLAYSLVFAAGGVFLLGLLFYEYLPIAGTIVLLAFVIAQFVASYRFGRSATLQEEIFIDAKELILMVKGIGIMKRQVFDLALVTQFRFLDKPVMAPHPLAGESFDYLGFQTEQQVINEMHGDNRIAFDYNGMTIKFGKNIYSWDFDEILQLLRSYGYASSQTPAVSEGS